MTLHIADYASYQDGLKLSALRAAGFTGVNFKVSHGITQRTVSPAVRSLAGEARAAGMQLSSFHWLTGDVNGTAQAEYAYAMIMAYGLAEGATHVVDVEAIASNVGGMPTATIYYEYIARMRVLLGRPSVTYTGDWWAAGRAWLAPSASSPWLWGAPAEGYLAAYPGDVSPAWETGYAGYEALAVMQYRVAAIAGIQVSQSACRSERIWTEMTGGAMASWVTIPASDTLTEEFNKLAPKRDKASDGSIGDTSHAAASSDHNPDETGNVSYSDTDTIDEVHAKDIDSDLNKPGWTMQRVINIILARCRSGAEKRIRYIIFNRKIWKASAGWVEQDYTGPSAHTEHAHFSFYYGSGGGTSNPENITSPYGFLAVAEEEDVALDASDKAYIKSLTDAVIERIGTVGNDVLNTKIGNKAYETRTLRGVVNDVSAFTDDYVGDGLGAATRPTKPGSLGALLKSFLVNGASIDVDEAALANLLAPALISPLSAALLAAIPEGTLTSDEVTAATEKAVRNVLTNGVG